MPKFLSRVSLGPEAVRLVRKEKAAARRAAVQKLIEAAGGKLEALYFAYGQDDVIIISDLPDATASVAISLVANSHGNAHVSLTPLITVEQMDQAVDRAASLPSPVPNN